MQKWIIATLLSFIVQSAMVETLHAAQQTSPYCGFQTFASYWLTNQPSLVSGENVVFNLPQALSQITYDSTTGVFTLPSGVYAINFFATPNTSFQNTLNLNVNGTIIPTPGLEGSMVVIPFSGSGNQISVQATGAWAPQTGGIASYFFAYASIAMYQVAISDSGYYACLYNSVGQTLTTGQNVLFANEISLQGITYDNTTGLLTLPAGTYSISYFAYPSGNLNLVANGTIIPNSPLEGSATILSLSNATNTLALQAQSSFSLPSAPSNQCSAMITVYQVN